jgi:hypothetical protein
VAVVALFPKEHLQLHPTHRGARMPWHDAMEGEPAQLQLSNRMPSFSIELRYRRLMLLPPLMSMQEKRQVCVSERTIGSRTKAYSPGLGISGG